MKAKKLHRDKVNITTLGCSKNMVDSEVLSGQLQANGIAVQHEHAPLNQQGPHGGAQEEGAQVLIADGSISPLPGDLIRVADPEAADAFHREAQIAAAHLEKRRVVGTSRQLRPTLRILFLDCDAWAGSCLNGVALGSRQLRNQQPLGNPVE